MPWQHRGYGISPPLSGRLYSITPRWPWHNYYISSLPYSLFSELSELFFYPTSPIFSSASLQSWISLFLSVSPASELCPTLRNFCLVFLTLTFLLNTNPHPLLVVINRSPFCLLFPSIVNLHPLPRLFHALFSYD